MVDSEGGNEGRLRPEARDGLVRGREVGQEWDSQSHLELPGAEGPQKNTMASNGS